MNDMRDELLDRVVKDEPPETPPNERMRKAMTRWFDGRRNVVLAWTYGYLFLVIALIIGGLNSLAHAHTTKAMLFAFVPILVGLEVNVLMKLWAAIMGNRIGILQDLKQWQLRMQSEMGGEGTNGTSLTEQDLNAMLPDDFLPKGGALFERIRPQTFRRIGTLVLVLGASLGFLFVEVGSGLWFASSPGMAQVDEWHITESDDIAVKSTISWTHRLGDPFKNIALPYASGEIDSISMLGQPLPFSKIDWRRYEIECPPHLEGEEERVIEIAWTFPVDALTPEEKGFRARLSSLLPTSRYRLDVILDPNSGFELIGTPGKDRYTPYDSDPASSSKKRHIRSNYGATKLMIQARAHGVKRSE